MALDAMWEASFPERKRPELYTSETIGDDGYKPLNEPSAFLMDPVASLTPAQLYALSANNAKALELAQREWTSLEKLANHIKTRDPTAQTIRDPQALPSESLFEEEKEALLYGYKYERNRKMLPARFTVSENVTDQEKFDCREDPEPFLQGGFIPGDKQYKTMMAAAKSEGREKNPDAFQPYEENFALIRRPRGTWIPRGLSREDPQPYKARGKDGEHRAGLIEGGESRRTRFNGERVPPTNGRSPVPSLSGLATPRGKRSGTPADLDPGTPSLKKRRLDTGGAENGARARWPNQYTKRHELEAQTIEIPLLQPQVHAKHPNQYTKRREAAEMERMFRPEFHSMQMAPTKARSLNPAQALANGQSRAGSQTPSDFSKMSAEEKRTHNFKDKDLLEAIGQDHLWLNEDPTLATQWKDKILAAEFPVRTLAMLRKWHEWKKENRHKRPRNKKKLQDGEDSELGGDEKAKKRDPKIRRVVDRAGKESPAPASPLAKSFKAEDMADKGEVISVNVESQHDDPPPPSQPRRMLEYQGTEDELHPSPTPEDDDKDGAWRDASQASEDSRPGYVNGLSAEMMQRTQSQPSPEDTVTVHAERPTPARRMITSPTLMTITPTRRSARNSRRDST